MRRNRAQKLDYRFEILDVNFTYSLFSLIPKWTESGFNRTPFCNNALECMSQD